MSELFRNELGVLTAIGKSYINPDFFDSSRNVFITDKDAGTPLSPSLNIKNLLPCITEVIGRTDVSPNKTDGEFAESLHKTLAMSRRSAVMLPVWHYLTCLAYPDYVRFRWTSSGGQVSKERFLGGLKRNAFSRLWWAAEILHEGEDYSLVKACFAEQDLYETVFGRSLSKFTPAARLVVTLLKDKPRNIIRETAKRINRGYKLEVFEKAGKHLGLI